LNFEFLLKIRHGNYPPHIVGQVTLEDFINQVYRPEDIMHYQQEDRMIIIPANQQAVNPQQEIQNATISGIHDLAFIGVKQYSFQSGTG